MSSFLQIPGFGLFNKSLPDAIGYASEQAVDWVKGHFRQQEVAKEVVAAMPQEQEPEELAPPPYVPEQAQEELSVHLATAHSVQLEEQMTKSHSSKRKSRSGHSHHHHHHKSTRKK